MKPQINDTWIGALDTRSTRYLLIENPGIAAPESFTLLGASNKPGTDAIGQFGSGTKFGVLCLLRDKIYPTVYCGNLKILFSTKQISFDGASHDQLQIRLSGKDRDGRQVNRTEDLSVVLGYGKIDWTDIRLAAREFVSNALDAVNGDASQVNVKIVDGEPRAKANTTRVYIPLDDTGNLEDFIANLPKWFLHFSSGKVWRNNAILEKDAVSPARIYRRGVFVREVRHASPSIYDYNLNDLPLDEARVANDYTVKSYAGKVVRNTNTPQVLAKIAVAKDTWETSFDLAGTWEYLTEKETAERREAWAAAQDIVLGARGVFLGATADESLTVGKGYTPVRVSQEVLEAAEKYGLRTPAKILTADEREGRRVDKVEDTDPRAQKAVLHVWNKLVGINATRGEQYPEVRTYSEDLQGERRTLGLWKDNVVYINKCLLSNTIFPLSSELFAVCLEELAHHITKATDNSRDFQEYFIQTLTKVLQ